jgi:hypothetical protein
MSDADYERKFRSMAEPILPEQQIALLIDRVRTLEQVQNLGEVLQLTAPPRA